MIAPGVRSKCSSMSAAMRSSGILPLPNVSMDTDMGLSIAMAYETWISILSAMPAATMFFAT